MKEIKSLRRTYGFSQCQFACFIGVPVRTLQNWESGSRSCPRYVYQLILFKVTSFMEV